MQTSSSSALRKQAKTIAALRLASGWVLLATIFLCQGGVSARYTGPVRLLVRSAGCKGTGEDAASICQDGRA